MARTTKMITKFFKHNGYEIMLDALYCEQTKRMSDARYFILDEDGIPYSMVFKSRKAACECIDSWN